MVYGVVSNGVWSDDEVWLKDHAVCPRTSGYVSVEDMKNPHRSTDRAQTNEQTLPQRHAQQYILRSPDDFAAPSAVLGEQQAKTIGGDPILSVTKNHIMEIVRRACHELTATPFSDSPVCPKQLSYGSPHTGLESDPQPPSSGPPKSAVRGRSTTVKHSTESPPVRTSVRSVSYTHLTLPTIYSV